MGRTRGRKIEKNKKNWLAPEKDTKKKTSIADNVGNPGVGKKRSTRVSNGAGIGIGKTVK